MSKPQLVQYRRPSNGRARAIIVTAGLLLVAGCSDSNKASTDSTVSSGVAMAAVDSMTPDTMTAPGGPTRAEPQMQAVLDQLTALGGKPMETLPPEEARKQPTPAAAAGMVAAKAGKDTTPTKLVPGVTSVDRTIPGPAGPLPARIYTPEGTGPFPVVVYYHGGGWVIANKQVYDGGARSLAKCGNAVVVSVDYRLAPEHKFPAQHEDALATYRWAVKNAASIKGDPARMALAGESAGGNLAVATAVAARDAGLPMPKAVISIYPIAQPDTSTSSYVENANAKPLSRAMMGWFAKHTVRTPADLQDSRINLVKANLNGLPPVTIINAQIDPLRDDGAMLEQALKAANVAVERKLYVGVAHEFFGMGAVIDKAKDAEQYAGDRLKAAFGK
ncbi:alpha/beta hydrolase [Gemmatimonas sp.]|uniref:alpha/beta hydrolase n=1 Tax=Gemmatimonas sp. TaxID=1962908 RepID=UPI00356A6F4D